MNADRLLRNETGRYPAYSWLSRYYVKIGRTDCALELLDAAADAGTARGADGMVDFEARLRGMLNGLLRLSPGSV